MNPAIPLLGIYPGEMESSLHADLYLNVPRSFIHNSQGKKPNQKKKKEQENNSSHQNPPKPNVLLLVTE